MKRSSAMKMSLVGAVVALGVFAADDSRTKDMNKGKADAAFVEQAALGSVTEIKMSQLAVTQSTNASVKELAQQLIDDHTKAIDSLKEIATNKGIMLPFDAVGSGSTGSSGSSGSAGSDSVGTGSDSVGMGSTGSTGSLDNTGNSGATGSTGSDTTGSDRMGSAPGTGSVATSPGTGSGSTGSIPGTGAGSIDSPSGASDPAASGERMGAGDRMNTDAQNTYGQLPRATQKKYDDLAKLSGDRFDREYLSSIVASHKKSVKLFEKESKSGVDAELKTWATNTLPTLKHHLEMAQSVEKEVKNRRTGSM